MVHVAHAHFFINISKNIDTIELGLRMIQNYKPVTGDTVDLSATGGGKIFSLGDVSPPETSMVLVCITSYSVCEM